MNRIVSSDFIPHFEENQLPSYELLQIWKERNISSKKFQQQIDFGKILIKKSTSISFLI